MISALRRGHRDAWLVLALVLPAVYAAALAHRPPAFPAGTSAAWRESGMRRLFSALPVGVAPLGDTTRPSAVRIAARDDLGAPDVLVYWMPAATPVLSLPRDAVLLGPLPIGAARRYELPPPRGEGRPALVLFSLARERVLGTAPLPMPAAALARALTRSLTRSRRLP